MDTSYSRDDFVGLFTRERAEVLVTQDRISIEIGGVQPYQVAFSQIQSDRDILEHVMHLVEHTGVDFVTVQNFVHHARSHMRNAGNVRAAELACEPAGESFR